MNLHVPLALLAASLHTAISAVTDTCIEQNCSSADNGRDGQVLLQHSRHNNPRRSKYAYTPSLPYNQSLPGSIPGSLLIGCEGSKFVDCWEFFTDSDPTYGYVDYVSQSEAESLGIYNVTASGSVYLGSIVGQGGPAKSIRLQAKLTFSAGVLFVIDIEHMPTGYGTWPAWWSTGPYWPNEGEIDTIEAVEVDSSIYSTLHTSSGCSEWMVPDISNGGWCNAGNGCDGCGVSGPANSAGAGFNALGGGVYVTSWTDDNISMWLFPRGSIPQDIIDGDPQPSTWSNPYVTFPLGDSCSSNFFQNQQMVINLDFCGSWAGAVFPSLNGWPGGNDACEGYVRDANNIENLEDAYWLIKYVKVFEAAS
mmetsp:Transcript_19624/g.34727  ORF Transcript_19624/g.34727 Transcript_19624/m.34727 type:complete len:364 (+) Transcript_19624:50-1141(+)